MMNAYALDQLALKDVEEDVDNTFLWDKPDHWMRDKRLKKLDEEDRDHYLKLYARAYTERCELVDQRARRWLCV